MRRMALWVVALALISVAAAAAEKPSDFAWSLPIEADGSDDSYQFDLPSAVYRGVTRRDAGDLRVFNAAGEGVPHGFQHRTSTQAAKPQPRALTPFPLKGVAAKGLDGLHLRLERSGGKTVFQFDEGGGGGTAPVPVLGYLLDVTAMDQPIQALDFAVDAPIDYAGRVRVEASIDLARWDSIVAGAPLLSLQHAGARLEQRRVEFAPRKTKYLRISWTGLPPEARLTGVLAEASEIAVALARQWDAVAGVAVADKPGEYGFDLSGNFPLDRLRLGLPQPNTLAQVEILSRNRASDPWRAAARTVVYRLRRQGAEILSPEISIATNPDRYWLLRVDQRGGGLGAGDPQFFAGWVPHRLVFVARGGAPFTLAYGNRDAGPSNYAMETLVRGYDGKPAASGLEQVKMTQVAAVMPTRMKSPELRLPSALGGAVIPLDSIDIKKLILWSGLVASILLLAWMAWRLLRQMDAAPRKDTPPAGEEGGKGSL
jgi:Protein of unknown function (DUF3999)